MKKDKASCSTALMRNTFWEQSPYCNSIFNSCNDIILRNNPTKKSKNKSHRNLKSIDCSDLEFYLINTMTRNRCHYKRKHKTELLGHELPWAMVCYKLERQWMPSSKIIMGSCINHHRLYYSYTTTLHIFNVFIYKCRNEIFDCTRHLELDLFKIPLKLLPSPQKIQQQSMLLWVLGRVDSIWYVINPKSDPSRNFKEGENREGTIGNKKPHTFNNYRLKATTVGIPSTKF